jgi:hypothetical protein
VKLIKTQYETAVSEATASLTEKLCTLNYATAEEVLLTLGKDGDKGVSKLRWPYWSFCIGKNPDIRIKKDTNPLHSAEAIVIQEMLPAADISEVQARVINFKTKPTIIGLGIIDKLPQYIYLLKTPAELDYAQFGKQARALADSNGITPTKASLTPSTFWMHTGHYIETGAGPIELTGLVKSDGPTQEEIEATAHALVKNMWHEANTNSYWFADAQGVIRKRQEIHAKAEFISLGLSGTSKKSLSRADHFLRLVRERNSVDGVVEAPFRMVGPFQYGGRTILNRSQLTPLPAASTPTLQRPDPASNPCSTAWERFCAYTHALFGADQLPYIDALLCRTYLSLCENRETFKQAAILSGPANAGKTLWVSNVVVPLLGGRSGNLKNFLQANGSFTESLFASPVGLLDDQAHEEKDKTRFTAALKNLISSKHQEFHAKFMPEQGIPWQGAVWILCNLDSDSFASTLPNLGMSILDKLHLFKAQTPEGFDFTTTPADIQAALPLYARYLIDNERSIMDAVTPKGAAVKYGIQPFHNRDLLNNSRMTENATNVLEILEILREDHFTIFGNLVKITATEFINELEKIAELQPAARSLTPKKVGEALANLSKIVEWVKVETRQAHNSNRYTIAAPTSPAYAQGSNSVTIKRLPPAKAFFAPAPPANTGTDDENHPF